MTRPESQKADESLFALNEGVSGGRFISSWQVNPNRDQARQEVDSCGCACSGPTKA